MEFVWLFVAMGASILWGLVYVLDKKVLEVLSPLELMFVSSVVSTLILTCIFIFKGNVSSVFYKSFNTEYKWWILLTVLASFTASFMIIKSIQLSNATLAAIVEISYPLFTVLFSYIILKELTLTKDVFIGGAMIFLGVLFIAVKQNS